jgi:hypothetical protein
MCCAQALKYTYAQTQIFLLPSILSILNQNYKSADLKNVSVVAHTCNPSTQEAEAGGSWVPGQSGLHNKTLCQKKKKSELGTSGSHL